MKLLSANLYQANIIRTDTNFDNLVFKKGQNKDTFQDLAAFIKISLERERVTK